MKLYRKPTDCITLLHFHSHHPLSCKEGTIYSQALLNNMIISKDHILKEQCNNLTGILLARTYPLHVIIKRIKKALTNSWNYLLSQRTPHIQTDILPIITPQTWANNWQPSYTEIGTFLPTSPHSHHLVIQTFISLYQIQHYSKPLCSLYTNIWLLTARLIKPLSTPTHIHQYGHTHNDICMTI